VVNTAKIGRFDGEIKEVAFNDGDTIQNLLDKVNLSLGQGEGVNNDAGENVEVTTEAEEGEVYYVVGNYKQG
jgi:hypothetical protein